MKFTALPVLLTFTAALLGHPGAQATVASSATLSDFKITLLDLNPGDGIAPAMSFVGEGGPPFSGFASGRVTLRSLADYSDLYDDFYNNSGPAAPFSNASGSASHAGTSVTSSLTASADRLGPHVFTVQGSATPLAGTQSSYNGSVNAPGYISLTYSVTPYTLILFEGNVVLTASNDGQGSSEDSAGASAELFAYGLGPSAGLGSSQNSRDMAGLSATAGQAPSTLSRIMNVSFLNNSSEVITGQIKVNVYAAGVTSVPEASAVWLALAGGGVLFAGLAQRRARIAKRACTNSQA